MRIEFTWTYQIVRQAAHEGGSSNGKFHKAAQRTRKDKEIAFIVGSGRSGTHWLSRILSSSVETTVTVEKQPIYNLVLEMALNPGTRGRLFPRLVREYRKELRRCGTRHYIDKSHQNLWLAEELSETFPEARFIGIQREPYAVVASMLQHEDPPDPEQQNSKFPKPQSILEWHYRWREFPIPNDFLGIDEETAEVYESLTMTAKCALRWKAHRDRMEQLSELLGDRLHVVQYERLISAPEEEIPPLEDFLSITTRPIEAHGDCLGKWRHFLTPEQRLEIARITNQRVDLEWMGGDAR